MTGQYDYAIDPAGESTANKVLRWVGAGKGVLELGTASGAMTRELKRQGCRVTGVECVSEMAREAEPWCERMLVGDLETLDFGRELAAAKYDVIVAADVLEHLRDPTAVLERLRPHVREGGRLVLSVPNIGHAAVIAGLINGRFDYRDKGLLDRTHLRFFTRAGIEAMLHSAGWLALAWEANRVPPAETELRGDWLALSDQLRREFASLPDGDVYQFIVLAEPATESQVLSRQAEALQALGDTHQTLLREHERVLADLREHQKAFSEARQIIAARDAELADLRSRPPLAPEQAAPEHGDSRQDSDQPEATRPFARWLAQFFRR